MKTTVEVWLGMRALGFTNSEFGYLGSAVAQRYGIMVSISDDAPSFRIKNNSKGIPTGTLKPTDAKNRAKYYNTWADFKRNQKGFTSQPGSNDMRIYVRNGTRVYCMHVGLVIQNNDLWLVKQQKAVGTLFLSGGNIKIAAEVGSFRNELLNLVEIRRDLEKARPLLTEGEVPTPQEPSHIPVRQGRVKWYDEIRQVGCITFNDGTTLSDIKVHWQEIQNQDASGRRYLFEGDMVTVKSVVTRPHYLKHDGFAFHAKDVTLVED